MTFFACCRTWSRLRTSCAGILQHYEERNQRRAQSLQVLQQAKNVINVDNAEEIHTQLKSMAANTDQLAASLVSTSSHLAPAAAPAAPQPASLGMLSDTLGSLALSYTPVSAPAAAAAAPADNAGASSILKDLEGLAQLQTAQT